MSKNISLSHILGKIKTVLIAVLFVSALNMAFLYLYNLQLNSVPDTALELDTLKKAQFNDSKNDINSKYEQLRPEMVAVKKDKHHAYATTQGADYMDDIYNIIRPTLSRTFGGNFLCNKSDSPKELWNSCLSSDEFIYIRYHSPLPFAVIYMDSMQSSTLSDFADGESPIVYELFLLSNVAVARDIDGNVYSFTPKDKRDVLSLSVDSFDIYIEASALTLADFYSNIDGSSKAVLPSTVLFINEFNSLKLKCERDIVQLDDRDNAVISGVSPLLNINPDKIGSYYDEQINGLVYVATHGTLVFKESEISYTANEANTGGVSIITGSDLISTENRNYGIFETLSAIKSFVYKLSEINTSPIGGSADMLLSAVYSEGDKLIAEYRYFYNNVAVLPEITACKIEISQGRISALYIAPAKISPSANATRKRCLSPSWVLDIFLNHAELDTEKLYTLRYTYSKDSENASLLSAEWQLVGSLQQQK